MQPIHPLNHNQKRISTDGCNTLLLSVLSASGLFIKLRWKFLVILTLQNSTMINTVP